MGYLIGQFAQVVPVPGGVGAIDAGVTGALVLYGGKTSISTAGEVISHGLALLVPIVAGAVAFALLPGEIKRTRRRTGGDLAAPPVAPTARAGKLTSLASITGFIEQHSQWALLLMFALLALESFGLPLPGETTLIACGVLASQDALSIVSVIAVAIAAAIIGDNAGYWVARKGGRRLLVRFRLTQGYAAQYLPHGERFFAKHGGKAVFFGRFIAVLRVTAAWTAGIAHMGWWRFFAWNAAGGIVWATGVGLVAYFLGDAAAKAIGRYGLYAAGGALFFAAIGLLLVRKIERQVVEEGRD